MTMRRSSMTRNGNELWVARYNGPGNSFDGANALTVDASGVYVTGMSLGAAVGTSADYATIKYDTDGNERWVARYNGPGDGYDGAAAIVLDVSGNVYVTGQSTGAVTSSTMRRSSMTTMGMSSGSPATNGPGNGDDYAAAIALDARSNVYITGFSWGGLKSTTRRSSIRRLQSREILMPTTTGRRTVSTTVPSWPTPTRPTPTRTGSATPAIRRRPGH